MVFRIQVLINITVPGFVTMERLADDNTPALLPVTVGFSELCHGLVRVEC